MTLQCAETTKQGKHALAFQQFAQAFRVVGKVLAVCAVVAAVPLVGHAACSSATLDGTWLYRTEGKLYRAPGPNALTTDMAAAGIMRLQGGVGTATESTSIAGQLQQRTVQVTYNVDADCRGTLSLRYCTDQCAGVDVRNLTVSSDGGSAFFLNAVANTSITGEMHKAPSGECNAGTLTGTYRYLSSGSGLNGMGNAAPSTSSATFKSAGLMEIGGSIDDAMAFVGQIIPRQFPAGAVSLRPDCTGELGGGTLNPARVYASPDGKQFVLLNWFPGTIVSAWNYKQ